MERQPLLVVVGPTAVGKTELVLNLGERLGAEVVSADSMQVYRYMDIGTAKPTLAERQRVPHHLIDIVDPWEEFTVAEYQRLAWETLAELHARGRFPILSGGTGLYVRAVTEDYRFPPGGEGLSELRRRLQAEAAERGSAALHAELARVDPPTAARLHPHDTRRIIRALEVWYQTGQPFSAQARRGGKERYRSLFVGLTRPREKLYARIEARVDAMVAQGLVEEVRRLLALGCRPGMTALQALGYKEFLPYLAGEISLAEAVATLKRDTRHYAKRQLTWFRRDPRIQWYNLEEIPLTAVIEKILLRLQEFYY